MRCGCHGGRPQRRSSDSAAAHRGDHASGVQVQVQALVVEVHSRGLVGFETAYGFGTGVLARLFHLRLGDGLADGPLGLRFVTGTGGNFRGGGCRLRGFFGALAGLRGDGWNLGFVVETEHQVEVHLEEHLHTLPDADLRSRAILRTMKEDEARHADQAEAAGAKVLPQPIPRLMATASTLMKAVAYRF